jgi:Zn ribbon nucleic-acid-binding protein
VGESEKIVKVNIDKAFKTMKELFPSGVILCPQCNGYSSHISIKKDGTFLYHVCPSCGYDSRDKDKN